MPTYDYQCRSCGHTIEVIHPMTADGPTACELCGGPLRRVLFPAGIIFKGSGFYRNDARASNAGTTPPASRPTSDDSAAAPASSSDTAGGGSTSGESSGGGATSTEAPASSKPAPSSTSD